MNTSSDFNPYSAPAGQAETTVLEGAKSATTFNPRPCPRCDGTEIQPTPYSAWHGRRAPRAIQDVTCRLCGTNYNGENGIEYPPRRDPLIWFLIALVLFVMYFGGVFLLALL